MKNQPRQYIIIMLKRVIRALEYNHQTGKKISDHNKEQREHASPYNFKYFVLMIRESYFIHE